MGIVYLEDGRLADEFEIGSDPYVLKDALVMTPDAYALLTAEEVVSLKQARYDKWISIITAPPVEDTPSDAPQE